MTRLRPVGGNDPAADPADVADAALLALRQHLLDQEPATWWGDPEWIRYIARLAHPMAAAASALTALDEDRRRRPSPPGSAARDMARETVRYALDDLDIELAAASDVGDMSTRRRAELAVRVRRAVKRFLDELARLQSVG